MKRNKKYPLESPPDGGFFFPDTIVALATPRGRGALAIVRLSGDLSHVITEGIVELGDRLPTQPVRQLQLVNIRDAKGEIIDRCLYALYRKPHSYTGEDAAEFFLHGSPYIIAQVLEHCQDLGARLAGPGEFTQRAFLNGRMDLAQAEAVADLISATGKAAHRAALAQSRGALSQRLNRIREQVVHLCSLVELDIDFSDQDVPLTDPFALQKMLAALKEDLNHLAQSYQRGHLAREGAVVVIAGTPNVGKSTLFNALIGEDRAIVDAEPGTTRDAVEAVVEWEGLTIRLMDTAGQAAHFTGADQKAVDRAHREVQAADLVIWTVDLSSADTMKSPPLEMLERTQIIGNKSDLAGSGKMAMPHLRVSALKMEGLEAIKKAVVGKLLPDGNTDYTEGILTRERHLEAVKKALLSIERGFDNLTEKRGMELLAEDLRDASAALGEIIGEVTPNDVLNRIFADFCIGK